VTYLLSFELPGLPKTTNGSHGKWQAAAAERKKWRTAVKLIAKSRSPAAPLSKAALKLTRFSSVQPDHDNLAISFKSVVDGLRDAGVILDDRNAVVVSREYVWEKAPAKQGRIRVEVREVP